MAFVAALPLIASVAGIAGAGVSAYGAIQSGNATKSAANYQAAVAKNNQVVAEQNAEGAIDAGEAKSQATALKGRAVGGQIKANQAGAGINVNEGSAVDVQEAQGEQSQLDVETVLHNADLSAYGYRVQGQNYGAEAVLDKATGTNAQEAGYLKAGGGLLSSASSLGFKWGGTASDTSTPNNGSGIYTGDPTVPGFG